jgi:hypothetical protein
MVIAPMCFAESQSTLTAQGELAVSPPASPLAVVISPRAATARTVRRRRGFVMTVPLDSDQNATWIVTVPDAGVRGSAGTVASIVP